MDDGVQVHFHTSLAPLYFHLEVKKEITTLNTVQDLVKKHPNNAELGMKIRQIYG
jgi:hypothetical protein